MKQGTFVNSSHEQLFLTFCGIFYWKVINSSLSVYLSILDPFCDWPTLFSNWPTWLTWLSPSDPPDWLDPLHLNHLADLTLLPGWLDPLHLFLLLLSISYSSFVQLHKLPEHQCWIRSKNVIKSLKQNSVYYLILTVKSTNLCWKLPLLALGVLIPYIILSWPSSQLICAGSYPN